MSRARAALAVAALTVAGAAGLAAAPAMASDSGTGNTITVSQPTATDYSFTLNIAGAGIVINYTIDATGQVTGAAIGAITPATPTTPPAGSAGSPVSDPTTGLGTLAPATCTALQSQTAMDLAAQSLPTPAPTAPALSCTGEEITLTLADGTVISVELGDGGTSVEEVHAQGPSAPSASAEPSMHEQSETPTPSTEPKESDASGTEHDGMWSGQPSTTSKDGDSATVGSGSGGDSSDSHD